MQQIADWLKTLGMSEYAERFVGNKIDVSGHRRSAWASAEDVACDCGACQCGSGIAAADVYRRRQPWDNLLETHVMVFSPWHTSDIPR